MLKEWGWEKGKVILKIASAWMGAHRREKR